MSAYVKKDIYNKGTFLKKEDPFVTPVEYLEELTAIRVSPEQLTANAAIGKYAPKHQILIHPTTGLIYGQSDGVGGYVPLATANSSAIDTPVTGTVDGVSTLNFSFASDTGQRLVALAINVNAASDVQASEQMAAGIYSVVPFDSVGTLTVLSSGPAIERIAIAAIATTTYVAGNACALTEADSADWLSALKFVVAPTTECIALTINTVPAYTAGLMTSVAMTLQFAEAL
jgi:hypothetical protein